MDKDKVVVRVGNFKLRKSELKNIAIVGGVCLLVGGAVGAGVMYAYHVNTTRKLLNTMYHMANTIGRTH